MRQIRKLGLVFMITLYCMNLNAVEKPSAYPFAFVIERSKDVNQIVYSINTHSKSELDRNHPIDIFWIKKTDGNKIEPLTWIQNNYAYGIKILGASERESTFQFVSYSKRNFVIKRDVNSQFRVFTNINGQECVLQRIFIQLNGGSFWFPNITKIEVHGYNPKLNKKFLETIIP